MKKVIPHRSPVYILTLASCAFVSLAAVGCKRAEPQNAPPAAEAKADTAPPVVEGKVSGALLNAFFPRDDGDWDVIYTQEKEGFAQAKLENDGKEVATLSVSDFSENGEGLAKFKSSEMKVGGLPAQAKGKKGTVVLTGRFQVSVRSKVGSFTEDDRKAWIQKFDLDGLAALAN